MYKYRLIRVEPSKIVYWVGYNFGRYFPKGTKEDPLSTASDETKMETFAELLKTADEELPVTEVEQSQEWVDNLYAAEKEGIISGDERTVINSYRSFLRGAVAQIRASEKSLNLKRSSWASGRKAKKEPRPNKKIPTSIFLKFRRSLTNSLCHHASLLRLVLRKDRSHSENKYFLTVGCSDSVDNLLVFLSRH